MSEIRWDLSGTDKRCENYGPGHCVHWIHHKKSILEPGIAIPVQVIADDGGLFTLQDPDLLLQGWNHRPALVRNALQRSRGSAVWVPRWRLLVVSTGDRVNGASNVFYLGPLDDITGCAGVGNVASSRSQPHTSRSDSPHETTEEPE